MVENMPEIEEPCPKIPKLHESGVVRAAKEPISLLRVKKLSEKAVLPLRASPLSAGYDLSREDVPAPVVVVAAPAPALGEPTDLSTALQVLLRKSLAHGGLVHGLHEGAKANEKHAALLCLLAEDRNQPDYIKLVKALCNEHNVSLTNVPSAKTLGEWARAIV